MSEEELTVKVADHKVKYGVPPWMDNADLAQRVVRDEVEEILHQREMYTIPFSERYGTKSC
jgi:hypothetical protein